MTRSLRRGCRVRLLGYVSCISFSFSFIPFFLFRSLFVAGFRLLSVFFQFRLFAYLRPEIHLFHTHTIQNAVHFIYEYGRTFAYTRSLLLLT